MMVVKRTVLMTMAASPENVGPGRTRLDVSMEPEPGQFYVPLSTATALLRAGACAKNGV